MTDRNEERRPEGRRLLFGSGGALYELYADRDRAISAGRVTPTRPCISPAQTEPTMSANSTSHPAKLRQAFRKPLILKWDPMSEYGTTRLLRQDPLTPVF